MIQLKSLPTPPDAQVRTIGWDWMLGTDTLPYLANEVVMVSSIHAADGTFTKLNTLLMRWSSSTTCT